MDESRRQMLSIGVFFIIVVVAIMLFAASIIDLTLIVPVILVFVGFWVLVLAAMRSSSPEKYARSAFSTFAGGLLLIAVGGAWFLFTINPLYAVALVLLAFGALAVAAALRRK